MESIQLKENKIIFYIGLADCIFFSFCFIFSTYISIKEQDLLTFIICFIVFGGFIFLGIFLILSYYRRQLILYKNYILYTSTLGKTKTINYYEIKMIQSCKEKYQILSYDGKKLASFENNMTNFSIALSFLHEKGIEFKTVKNKNYLNQQQDIEFIKSHWKQEQIDKERQITKVLRYLSILLLIMSFFLPIKMKFLIFLFILFFNWCIYLYFYPKMTLDNKDQYHYPFPIFSTLLTIILLLKTTQTINVDMNQIVIFMITYSTILFISYLIIIYKRKKKEKVLKILMMIGATFIISLSSTKALNYIMTFSQPYHEIVQIIDKNEIQSQHGNTYHFTVKYHNNIKNMSVSKELYYSKNINDNVKICERESIFHLHYYLLHN